MHNCKARQYSDQMLCGACGLAWDVNDDDPPECLTNRSRYLRWKETVDSELSGPAVPPPAEQYHSGYGWY